MTKRKQFRVCFEKNSPKCSEQIVAWYGTNMSRARLYFILHATCRVGVANMGILIKCGALWYILNVMQLVQSKSQNGHPNLIWSFVEEMITVLQLLATFTLI